MTRVGTAGKRLDLLIKQGSTLAVPFAITDSSGLARDLTGYAVRAQIRKTVQSTSVTQSLTATVTDAVGGLFVLSLTATQTASIPAGPSPASPDSRYVWDLEIESPAGIVTPLCFGAVVVHAEVTR